MISRKHAEALAYAADGIPIFPCRVNGKEPACPNGFKDATTNQEKINEWWQKEDYNIGLCPADTGWCVVDIDPGGMEQWADFCSIYGWNRTASVQTPRLGTHFYYSGSLPPTTSKLGQAIDTRGIGSYVLVPPSSINGKEYQWADECPIAPLPQWIAEFVSKPKDVPISGAKGEPVTRQHVEDLLRYCGSANTSRDEWRDIVAAIRACNLGDDNEADNLEIALAWSRGDLTPDPPGNYTDDKAVEELFWSMPPKEDGIGYGTLLHLAREEGYDGPSARPNETAQSVFGTYLDRLKAAAMPFAPSSPYNPYIILTGQEIKQIPPAQWLVPDLIPELGIGMWYGDEGAYKTGLLFQLFFDLAHNIETFGHKAASPIDVLFLSGEGQENIAHKRLPALETARDKMAGINFHFMAEMPPIYDPAEAAKVVAAIRAKGIRPRLIGLDTMADAMSGLDENNVQDVRKFIDVLKAIKKNFGCATVSLHHTNKENKYRGSTGLKALDFRARVTAWDKTKAVALKIEKMRDAERREEPWTFQGQTVGQGLVFRPTTVQEHKLLTQTENLYEDKKIGMALLQLGINQEDKAVPTRIIADQLLPRNGTENEEEREALLGQACKTLNLLARTTLRAYCKPDGRAWLWFLTR